MIDFIKFRSITAFVSVSLMLSFAGFSVYRYMQRGAVFSYSIDFTGGTQVMFHFDNPVKADEVKSTLVHHGWESTSIREFSEQDLLVRVKEYANDSVGLAKNMQDALISSLGRSDIAIEQSDTVGSGIGETLRTKSVHAVFIALVLMLSYIAFRFWSWSFATGAVVALFHDAIAILLFFLLLDIEISVNVISAILTILGYSINDTIVIYSQIRDNVKFMGGTPMSEIVNISLNQTLRRTILTSVATALPVGIMCVFGGEALYDISFALLIGIIFGTYSSIYIASSIALALSQRKSQYA